MRPASRPAWCAALLVLAGCATTKPPTPEALPIKSFKIEGASQLSPGQIEDHLLTTGPSWWPFDPTPYFDPAAWQADLNRIPRYYQAEGYYQAQVVDDSVTRDGGGLLLKVKVQEGKPTRVKELRFEGLESVPQEFEARLHRRLPLQVGAIVTEKGWDDLKSELKTRLRNLGYAEAEVGGEILVETTDQTARVRVVCTTGPRYRFGSIFVASGARPSVKTLYVIEEAEGAIRTGDWYSDTAMANAQRRVFRMGVFGAVKVTLGSPDRQNATVPVIVDVREAPFHTIRYGGGLGVDPVRQEYRLTAEYTDRNFLGDLRRLTLRGKVGWAFLPALWSIDQNGFLFNLHAEFEQPRWPARNFRFLTSAEAYKNIEQAYSYYGVKGKLGIIWEPVLGFTIYPSYNIEVDRITGNTNGLTGNAPALAYGCNFENSNVCYETLSYGELVIAWDKRDDKLEPRNGWYLSFGIQKSLGGGYQYVRLFPEARGYVSWKRWTLAGKLRIGTLLGANCTVDPITGKLVPDPCQDSPITARFFSGGGTYHRGFGTRQLSPMLAVPNSPSVYTSPLVNNGLGAGQLVGEYVPVGGNGLWDSSIELRYHINRQLTVAVFLDAGYVSTGAFDFRDVGPMMQYAIGFGLRYNTLVGPIRLDFAYRLNHGGPLPVVPNPTQPVLVTNGGAECFGIGTSPTSYAGYPAGRCAITLSIGEAY
jgi:translocation and assembly module TamA